MGHWQGLALAALSSVFFSLCSLAAKFLSGTNPMQLSCVGLVGILVSFGPIVIVRKESIFPRSQRGLLFFRSFCGTVFLVLGFHAAQVLPLGEASVLLYTAPIFTLILARWILEEPCPPNSLFIIASIVIGVLLVTQPSLLFDKKTETNQEHYWHGVASALLASFSEAIGNITLRRLKDLHFSVVLTNYAVSSLIQVTLVSFFLTSWGFPQKNDIPIFLLLGVFTSTEQFLMTLALRIEHAGPVALVQASDIVYGYIYQVAFFGESLNIFSVVGASIVASVIIYLTSVQQSLKYTHEKTII